MTDTEIERIGHNASLVLENEAYALARAAMHADIYATIKACPSENEKEQLKLAQLAKLCDMFHSRFLGYVERGKLAGQHRIDLDSVREESGMRKLMRRVL